MDCIYSKTNRLVKDTKKLHQKKHRKTSYLIEGWHLLDEAVKSGATIERVFVQEEFAEKVAHLDHVVVVSRDVLTQLANSQTPQGVVAQLALSEQVLPTNLSGRYLFLEDVQDPGNVGTMIRTADAAGLDAVFISAKSADIYSLKVLRSMQGSHFHLPIYRVEKEQLLHLCKHSHIPIYATTLSDNSQDYKKLSPPNDFLLVMGNESRGISKEMTQDADHLVHIPMLGQAESLNVAVAAGIVLFSFI